MCGSRRRVQQICPIPVPPKQAKSPWLLAWVLESPCYCPGSLRRKGFPPTTASEGAWGHGHEGTHFMVWPRTLDYLDLGLVADPLSLFIFCPQWPHETGLTSCWCRYAFHIQAPNCAKKPTSCTAKSFSEMEEQRPDLPLRA